MNEKRNPSTICGECGEPSFAIYLSKDGVLCDKCEDKRRERREKDLELQHLPLPEEMGYYAMAQIPSDRRSGANRRKSYRLRLFINRGVERRGGTERRSIFETRQGFLKGTLIKLRAAQLHR
jgi:hypothetical protein